MSRMLLLMTICFLFDVNIIQKTYASFSASSSSLSSSSSSTLYKYQTNSISSENDDDYLSQKENVLEKSYHGLIRENETSVEITPLIKVDEEKICNFHIIKKPYHEIPFQIELINNLGILKARRTLNCEKRKSYHFEIVAVFCDGTHSAAANVHIAVIDVNEYAPTFLQPSYVCEADEGRLYKEIIRVEAIDKDCTPLYGDVCKYELLNKDQPFTIDNEGSIKNTEPLSHKVSHNYILSVVAYDCAMKQSSPIMVSIKVRRVCEAKFLGIPARIDYTTSSTESLSLFPNARLELCDMYCDSQNLNIHTSISLKTKHISFGCDRDITNCSQHLTLVDLLPRNAEWTRDLSYDEGSEPIFHFDGSSGVIIPDKQIARHDFSQRPFSIITIFRHFSGSSGDNKHVKEHIVCSADDHKMNRHHMALFVRNCRLILLLRKNFNEGDLNIFSPAEWRWKIPQVCDNEWHHYVLNVDQNSKVELYVDGVLFENSLEDRHNNPEVIDDWPLHAAHGVNTTLAVGACYQSSENRLKHGFNGDISEIKISLNAVLTNDDVKCGTNCAEHLLPPPETLLEPESQVQTNSQLNEIYIEGQSKSNVELLLQKIQYINTKENPTIGRRNIEVRTTMMCINQSAIRLPTVETFIMVNEPTSPLVLAANSTALYAAHMQRLEASYPLSMQSLSSRRNTPETPTTTFMTQANQKPQDSLAYKVHTESSVKFDKGENSKILITGNSNNLVSYPEIKSGVHILGNINISIVSSSGEPVLPQLQILDTCSVIVFPSLNPDHEEIQVDGDENLSTTLDIKTNINKDGVEMIGPDSISNYLDVLNALVYSNKKPAYYLNRVFKVTCSQMNSQFKSAEFTLTLTVLHPKQVPVNNGLKTTTAPSSLTANGGVMQTNVADGIQYTENKVYAHAMTHQHDAQEPKSRIHSITHKAESAHPTMLIILICVFLVILLGGVSIARLKNNSNQKFTDRHQPCPKIADEALVWDDSALTITINPMQSDAVSDGSSDSENSDSEDEDLAKGRFANVSQLEWDNSNMFTTAVN
ncbi:calsyntenin-1 [Lucilia cuprina]|uniref:calsyntenin-1 n=1 Tax=Lucilia cuprina TaxID=7375 RepID=UPI001F0671F2|nr:calsyntenin-1 [Lucilia cuprina]XP_046801471.1 calsyntenin-1 [Lucilia cuprina]